MGGWSGLGFGPFCDLYDELQAFLVFARDVGGDRVGCVWGRVRITHDEFGELVDEFREPNFYVVGYTITTAVFAESAVTVFTVLTSVGLLRSTESGIGIKGVWLGLFAVSLLADLVWVALTLAT